MVSTGVLGDDVLGAFVLAGGPAAVPVPPLPPAPAPSVGGLNESSGSDGGYLVPAEYWDGRWQEIPPPLLAVSRGGSALALDAGGSAAFTPAVPVWRSEAGSALRLAAGGEAIWLPAAYAAAADGSAVALDEGGDVQWTDRGETIRRRDERLVLAMLLDIDLSLADELE